MKHLKQKLSMKLEISKAAEMAIKFETPTAEQIEKAELEFFREKLHLRKPENIEESYFQERKVLELVIRDQFIANFKECFSFRMANYPYLCFASGSFTRLDLKVSKDLQLIKEDLSKALNDLIDVSDPFYKTLFSPLNKNVGLLLLNSGVSPDMVAAAAKDPAQYRLNIKELEKAKIDFVTPKLSKELFEYLIRYFTLRASRDFTPPAARIKPGVDEVDFIFSEIKPLDFETTTKIELGYYFHSSLEVANKLGFCVVNDSNTLSLFKGSIEICTLKELGKFIVEFFTPYDYITVASFITDEMRLIQPKNKAASMARFAHL